MSVAREPSASSLRFGPKAGLLLTGFVLGTLWPVVLVVGLQLGLGSPAVAADAPAQAGLTALQTLTLSGGKVATLSAGDALTLSAGKSSIVLKKDGSIILSGNTLSIVAPGGVSVKAPSDTVIKGTQVKDN